MKWVLAGVRFERSTKLRLKPLVGILLVAVLLVPLSVWRNVTYANESLLPSIEQLKGEVERLRAEVATADADTASELQAAIEQYEEQLVADQFDVYRSTAPGSVEVALGLGASVGALGLGLLLAAVLVSSEYRDRRIFYWLAIARRRVDAIAAKALVIPVIAAAATAFLAILGLVAGTFLNWLYRDEPTAGWSEASSRHLAAAFVATVVAIAVWSWICSAVAFVVRSGLITAVIVLCYIALDATLTLTWPGAGHYLLTMRFAQIASPLWPPATKFTIDTVGYQWWISVGGDRFAATPAMAAPILLSFCAALFWLGWRRLRTSDVVWM
jgi:hypothetical protein